MVKILQKMLAAVLPLTLSLTLCADAIPELPIVVVIASFNNNNYYQKNLDSVFCQQYTNYRVIYINDCSEDETGALVAEYVKQYHQEARFTLINNEHRVGGMCNLYNAIHSCNDLEIIVTLDGDDWFTHDRVLARINQEYVTTDAWLTYGQFQYSSGMAGFAKQIPRFVREKNIYRMYTFVSTHPRTFYAWLFKKIKKEDLYYKDTFYTVTWDQALMYPMLEMAGEHAHFIPEVLYMYNGDNPINDGRIRNNFVLACEKLIREQPKYELLVSAPSQGA